MRDVLKTHFVLDLLLILFLKPEYLINEQYNKSTIFGQSPSPRDLHVLRRWMAGRVGGSARRSAVRRVRRRGGAARAGRGAGRAGGARARRARAPGAAALRRAPQPRRALARRRRHRAVPAVAAQLDRCDTSRCAT